MKYLFLALAMSCGSPYRECVSRCGAWLNNPDETEFGGCVEFQKAEDAAIASFEKHVTDRRFATLCDKLDGWEFNIRPVGKWMRADSEISGATWCGADFVQVGNAPWSKGSYAHELAHIAQGCRDTSVVNKSEPLDGYSDHYNWAADGIYAATDAFSLYESTIHHVQENP